MDSKAIVNTIQEWLHLKNESPIPPEIFSADQLVQHAITLALAHTLAKKTVANKLLRQLSKCEAALVKSCKILNTKNSTDEGFSPAKEWLLDNFYLIQENIQSIRRDLPQRYNKALPQLTQPRGRARVYDIATQIINHGDGRWDLENLNNFLAAYQSVKPLTLAELWAIPITLNIALIESLSCASRRIVTDCNDRTLANIWADKLIDIANTDPKNQIFAIAKMARAEPEMSSAYITELTRRLQNANLALALNWVEQHLAEEQSTIEQMIQEENKRQAMEQTTVSNCIASLRRLDTVNWHDFVEKNSVVNQILQQDPSDTYRQMDFNTRDRYRHVIENLARTSLQSESEVAKIAIQLTQETNSHIGFYLIGKNRWQLEKILKIPCARKHWVLFNYLISITFITCSITATLLFKASQNSISYAWLWILGIVVTLCASQVALAVTNLGATLLVKPKPLPKMDFSQGIPSACRTLVVVPGMLGSIAGIEKLVEALEIRFLGNRDNNIYYALLTDFNDAPNEHLPQDDDLLNYTQNKINELNNQYSCAHGNVFFLFHRPRQWNPNERVWMGSERKRGKLCDLNNFLKNNIQTPFSRIVGDISNLHNIKYVITLDCDTQLPRECARQLVGAMAHPLNLPTYNADKQLVTEGYGILQPRIAEALPTSNPTRYVWLFGGEFGIDPYTRTVSDVYQDVFGEGSFIGKGIYDVDIFQQVLAQRFPDNQILSHDLLEGCYLRSGFLSDVPLYEKSPSSYLADAKRRSRWTRGDWQIIGWLFPRVLNGLKQRVVNPLSGLSKWKIFDNLRRSLTSVALLILLILSATILPGSDFWLISILTLIISPTIMNLLLELVRKPKDIMIRQHFRRIEQLIFLLTCLPHEAYYNLTAILVTCWRLIATKKHLLEWESSEQVKQRLKNSIIEWIINMWMGPATATVVLLILLVNNKTEFTPFVVPLLILWFLSPIIAYKVSQPFQTRKPRLNASQVRFLHSTARKTWGFFETFVTAEDHWLPPDNYQETPIAVLARRTSPTNIGLALLANLTAYDFGYITMSQLLERTKNTLQTMSQMERYRGHLYNWYSTETLEPLLPRYISTVDSGNLSAHLLTLRQGLLALLNAPLLNMHYLDGLQDTWDILVASFIAPLPEELDNFQALLQSGQESFTSWPSALALCDKLYTQAKKIDARAAHSEWSSKLLLQCEALQKELNLFALPANDPNVTLRNLSQPEHKEKITLIESLANSAFILAQMDISFLYNEANHLMTIGFNVDKQQSDPSYYDLLASEARLATFVAIAQGQVLQESWFALGRLTISSNREPLLVSWSGSMFEYLMPLLVMPTYPYTLLDQTYHAVVKKQISYGKQLNVPWGVSESGYNAVDNQFNYLYRAFGVPGLGFKRGLEEDLVIAPYATAMALMVAPQAACLNLQKLTTEYALGEFGFYEAIDYTRSRLPHDKKRAIVRSFMVHHQGMSFLAFSYLLHNKPMQRRFIADPLFRATLLLLQERRSKPFTACLQIPKSPIGSAISNRPESSIRVFNHPNTRTPQVQLLSNGRYHLVLSQAGGGYSRWKNIALSRWREDTTCDNWGLFSYISDVKSGEYWSINCQPTPDNTHDFQAIFSEAHVDFKRTEKLFNIHSEIVVSPEDDIELRRIRIHNRSKTQRIIEFTSYAEIVLAPQAADLSQPAFSNLFVETELLAQQHAILATRRPQDAAQCAPWLCHLLNVYSDLPYTLSFETDRARFVGRCRTLASPLAMITPGSLSNTQGAVLDPIVAIRCRVTLKADALVTFDLFTGIAETRENCVALVEKYQDQRLANRVFGLAWTYSQVLLHQLNISEEDAQLFGKLASGIIYASSTRRAKSQIIASNQLGQSSLWRYAISGDLPIILLHIEDANNIEIARKVIQAQAYWLRKGLLVDVIILNEEKVSYRQILQDQLMSLTTSKNNIAMLIAEQVSAQEQILLQSVARVILSDKRGTLKEQLGRRPVIPKQMPLLPPFKTKRNLATQRLVLKQGNQFFNGTGGFSDTGNEYIIQLTNDITTPAPWVNILANAKFGTVVSESGQAYTWIENSHEFRLTPWENDPLRDASGEAFYLRDDETGESWSPTALPRRGLGDYQTRHGFGYSIFEHIEDDIYSELHVTVAIDTPVKFAVLKIRNDSMRNRQLSVFGFVSWVLGDLRDKYAAHVVTLSKEGALFAQNHYNTDFGDRTAFFNATTDTVGLKSRTISGDRTEFLGRNGSYYQPAALARQGLSGRVGAALDPGGAIHLAFNLSKGQTREITFTLGAGQNLQDAQALIVRYQGSLAAQAALSAVRAYWQHTLGLLSIKTPDATVNLLTNGWLHYQVLSSRLWGRTGYYQSSGAFGFRDQLQDAMSLTHIAPELLRAHLLLCAGHQFEEGDVQHWWHPPHNQGVRTRCSDDYLWLPFALCHYIETTGDTAILDEKIPFLQGRPLKPEEESYYELPTIGHETASLYQHAVRAINHGLQFGEHGLPLIGSGDWNDGMNMVGIKGKGESVWLGFFLYSVLKQFSIIATHYQDAHFAQLCNEVSHKLQQQVEANGWDGKWYRRAYFDDGTPLGAAVNNECKIDSIAQSWSVLSNAADPLRAKQAMESLHHYLVSTEDGLVKLLTPPFDKSVPNPGYIQGYLPGIRENGGQYTHAAVWAAMAFAKLGETQQAWQLLNIINPINHGRDGAEINRYKIEPYVLAGDVYSVAPHIGHGGWSWYTGSAGWLYRLITETLLGIQLVDGKQLRLKPQLPAEWDGFSLNYHYGNTLYTIIFSRTAGDRLDEIKLIDDGQTHYVNVKIQDAASKSDKAV